MEPEPTKHAPAVDLRLLRQEEPLEISPNTLLAKSIDYLKSLQRSDGYWWFTLEANESIGAEFIFLMHYLEEVDEEIQRGLSNRILDIQRDDGTWSLYNEGPPSLSTTIECYFALKIAGLSPESPEMVKAREFILASGGIEKARVFTKIHLAMFGLIPWSAAPAMPAEYILMPLWSRFSIYEFSSWARATIVPLLIFISMRKVIPLTNQITLDELFIHPEGKRNYSFSSDEGFMTWGRFFIYVDYFLKLFEKIPFKPFRARAIRKCADWLWSHVSQTEDIYPALAYCAFAFKALGFPNDAPQIQKPLNALKMFQQRYELKELPPLPDGIRDNVDQIPSLLREKEATARPPPLRLPPIKGGREIQASASCLRIHQQCCISPVWDTPWTLMALLEAGVPADDPALLLAGRWLLGKQITKVHGDWVLKNPHADPGGWAFEFENDYFPDVDDTIEVLHVITSLSLPEREKLRAITLGFGWLLSMQGSDGGWAAFDRDQTQTLVNRMPFSDHDACLDPSSPDITGRMLELMAARGLDLKDPVIVRAIDYLWRTQEAFGGWWARWGINYIYGTWCALTGLTAIGIPFHDPRIVAAVHWLESVQHRDGGFSESPESYELMRYVPLPQSTASQTGWALMGLTAAGSAKSTSAKRAADFLIDTMNENGCWDEHAHTGTGFPGHFYIRYHGYRHFFPLLALARYFKAIA